MEWVSAWNSKNSHSKLAMNCEDNLNTLSDLAIKLVSSKHQQQWHSRNKGRVTFVALPFTLLTSILREKKKYGNSNISRCKNIIFKKSSKRNQNPSRYYNTITNLKFQHKPKYHLSKILI
jgi:hypothetical protein